VQPVTGKFTHLLPVKADGADVAGAVMQPAQLLPVRQRQAGEVVQLIPLTIQRALKQIRITGEWLAEAGF